MKLTQAEFSRECGCSRARITKAKKDGLIVVSGGKIDTENLVNKVFLENTKANRNIRPKNGNDPKKETPPQEPKAVEKTKKQTETKPKEPSIQEKQYLELRKQTEEETLRKKQLENELALLKVEKLRGDNIPLNVAADIVAQLSKEMVTEFKNGVDAIITVISKQKRLSIQETAKIKGELIQIINFSVDRAIINSKESLETAQKEEMQRRGRGEKM